MRDYFENDTTLPETALLLVLVLLEPSHLDCLQFAFRRCHGIVFEIRQLRDPLVKVRIADVGGIYVRMSLIQAQGDIFDMVPG